MQGDNISKLVFLNYAYLIEINAIEIYRIVKKLQWIPNLWKTISTLDYVTVNKKRKTMDTHLSVLQFR